MAIKGRVKFYDSSKGYGFIWTSCPEPHDIYFHATGLGNDYVLPVDGDVVTFEVKQGRRGSIASNVNLVKRRAKLS